MPRPERKVNSQSFVQCHAFLHLCIQSCSFTLYLKFIFSDSDLHRERERLIQERLGNALPPYIRAEMHSHNHQHVHQHNHNHTHLPSQQHPGGGINPLTPPTASLLTPSLSHLVSGMFIIGVECILTSVVLPIWHLSGQGIKSTGLTSS